MGLIWRRKSSVFKLVIALVALWFTIVFFTYSDDRSSSNNNSLFPPSSEKLVQKALDNKKFNRYESNRVLNDMESLRKQFQEESFKDAHIDKVVNLEKNDGDEYEENSDNVINGNVIVNAKDESTTAKKRPSKKRGQIAIDNSKLNRRSPNIYNLIIYPKF
jgi:hypothetical protein